MFDYFKITNRIILFILFSSTIFSGCSKYERFNQKDVIAYVNKEPILASELARDIALRQRQDPAFRVTPETEAEQLNTIINKKLLVQKAMEKGLAREERFVNTIKSFWEQTLIRDFIEYKQKGFKDRIFVTEDEIKNYYDRLPAKETLGTLDTLRPEIKKRVSGEKEIKLFDDWLESEREKAGIKIIANVKE